MCPEDRVLSSFLDHELPAGSSERVEEHVSGCEECRTRLRTYQTVSHRLLECDEPDVEEVGMRIWRRIEAQAPAVPVWRRWLLRLPIAAATAAVAIAFVFTMALGGGVFGGWLPGDRTPAEPGALQPLAMTGTDGAVADGILSPLGTRNYQPLLELALPDTNLRLFSSPTIVRESELPPSAPASLALDTGVAVTLKVQLPPARYRLVGMPTIWHEAELETSKP